VLSMKVFLLLMLFGRLWSDQLEQAMPRWMLVAAFVWHFIGLPIAVATLIIRGKVILFRSAVRLFRRRPKSIVVADEPAAETAELLSRRMFFMRSLALTPPLNHLTIPVRSLPSAIDGLTIAHISDTHIGQFTLASKLKRIADATNDLDVDLVLQTGDLINHDQDDLTVAGEFIRALRGRHGQFLCEGNHDLIQGRAGFERFVESSGLPFLINDARTIRVNGAEVQIMGLPWVRAARRTQQGQTDRLIADAVEILNQRRRPDAFAILLAHHPHAFDAAAGCEIPLTLSGHTHGGQLHLSKNIGFGPLMYRYWTGHYQNQDRHLVVSNGTGNWFPLRINVPAEILHITLKKA
jgi:uncharacterized protein